ncbi:peptidase M42 [Solitalea longa]|uniref:Peptidase M42 n=1 Tax=Solitalea longa TaxID=2079460 RepID=A0A2S4ZYN2_9SPHI|nr:M42 family metallopeptidase [Solitalea longa]POY35042.1 peptidase M42 [Solitalea longa]
MSKKKEEKKHQPVVTKKSLDFFEKYINNPSPTGFEWSGQKMWLDYLKPYIDEHYVDNYGTAVGVINPKAEYKVVIEAHADEISWFVNYITNDGLIYVIRNGGSDHQIAPSKRVNIHTDKGIVKAVFGWPAIHTRNGEKEEAPTLKNIFLDCGCTSKEEVEKLGIHVGCVITYEDEFMVLNDRYYVGRALDNRAGGFMIAEVARLLKENKKKLPFGLYIVNSVQEEIGLRGAEMIANRIKPNVAIVTDVTHDTNTPMINKITQGDLSCGKGPVISYAPAVHNNLNKLLIEAAEKNDIPFQRNASSRATGTDTDAFAYSNGGVFSALISLPLRYMHTTVEMVHKEDLDNVISLIYHSILNIKEGHDFRYIK